MNLHSRVPLNEILTELDRFEFLAGIQKKVLRMDEVHPSADNDSHYLFLIWVEPADTTTVEKRIRKNIRHADLDRDWSTHVLPKTGEGLIIISTWCH